MILSVWTTFPLKADTQINSAISLGAVRTGHHLVRRRSSFFFVAWLHVLHLEITVSSSAHPTLVECSGST
jgi:hypothetical protein